MASVAIKNQLKRYLRLTNVNNDLDLKKKIEYIVGQDTESVQQKQSAACKNVTSSQSLSNSSGFQSCKISANKQSSVQKIVQHPVEVIQEEFQTQIPIKINQNIIQQIKKKNNLLLGGVQNKQQHNMLTICAFMVQKQKWEKLDNMKELFDKQGRIILGIGLFVQDDFIVSSDLEYLQSFVKQKGLVLILNTKTGQFYLLELTNTIAPESDEKINYINNNTYLKMIAGNKEQINNIIDKKENTKTKQIKIPGGNQNVNQSQLMIIGQNVKNIFQYKFAQNLKRQISKKKPQRFVFFPQENDSIIKKCEIVSIERLQNIILDKNKLIIPVFKSSLPIQSLNLMWKNNITFGGIFNHRINICFFRIGSDPSNEKNIIYDTIQKGGTQILKLVSKYDTTTKQVQDVKFELS